MSDAAGHAVNRIMEARGIEPCLAKLPSRQHRSHSSDLILRQYIRINAGRKGQQNFYEVERIQ